MNPRLASSRGYCRRAARRANSSFPIAFRVLPPAKRDATTALYAFFRVTDDLADEPGDVAIKRVALADWHERLDAAIGGCYSHRTHAAVHAAVHDFGVDPAYLHAVITGVETDLEPARFANFAELYPYCYRVASAVGLACVPIWGATGDYRGPAEAAGIAFQLTNILRDLGEDLARGRVYLPADDLVRFDCQPSTWRDPKARPRVDEMLRFQIARAENYYRQAEPLFDYLSTDGRAIYGVMFGIYRRLLAAIARRPLDVFDRRIRVTKFTKARLLVAAWPTRWGW